MKTAERQLKKMHRRTLALLALLVAIAFPAAAHNRTPPGDLSAATSPAIAWNEPLGKAADVELEPALPIVDSATIAAFDEAARIDIELPPNPLEQLDAHLIAITSPAANDLLPIVSGAEKCTSGFSVSLIGPNVGQTNELSLKLHWGRDHVRNRWFDPNTGTWLTPDPLGYQDSSNLYAFAGGDPVNGRDPLGLCSAPDPRACFGRLQAALSSAVDDASAAVGGVGDWLREKAVGTAIAASSPMAVPVVTTAQFINTSVTGGPKAAVDEWVTTLPFVHTVVSGGHASDAAAADDLRAETFYRLETGYSAVGDFFIGYGAVRGLSGLMSRGPASGIVDIPAVEPSLRPPTSSELALHERINARGRLAEYKASLRTRDVTGTSPAKVFQREVAGPIEFEATGGGVKYWADNIRVADRALIDVKHVGNVKRSPFLLDSAIRGDIREFINFKVENEVFRASQIVADPTNDLQQLVIQTNDLGSSPYFEQLLNRYGVPGKVVKAGSR